MIKKSMKNDYILNLERLKYIKQKKNQEKTFF